MTDYVISDPKLLDKRIYQRLIKKGLINEKDYERHIKSLPDLEASSSRVEATIEPTRVGTCASHPDEE